MAEVSRHAGDAIAHEARQLQRPLSDSSAEVLEDMLPQSSVREGPRSLVMADIACAVRKQRSGG